MTSADRRKLNENAGFSLLELLIAVVILSIIVIPMMKLFVSSNRLNIKSRQTLRATTAAQDIMEGLKAYDIEELKAQFTDPASGFYVMDSRLIKGGVAEETSLEADGLYVFSMKELNMQGSKFDAKIVVDGRRYMSPLNPDPSKPADDPANRAFNSAAMADARSIDKKNGTFVESEKYRQAVLKSVFEYSDMENAIKARLKASGVADADMDSAYSKRQYFKDLTTPNTVFKGVSRTLTVDLKNSSEQDKDGNYMVDMMVTQIYDFTCRDAGGADVEIHTSGDMGSGVMVNALPCGKITRMTDAVTGSEKINVNIFYYPLYGSCVDFDRIVVNNESGADLNLLIAKQRHETNDPADPEYLMDAQLMAAEQSYRAEIIITDTRGIDPDKFSLKTNLGLNLVGSKYLGGTAVELPAQFTVNGTHMDLSGGSGMNIFTLDGVRSPMGRDPLPGEITELIYDVEVSVYEEGAAASGFPDDKRMIVIGGSTTN